MIRLVFVAVTLIFPWRIRRLLLRVFLGFEIAPTAYIGFSIVLPRHLDMGDGARIGHLTMAKGLDRIQLDSHARLGNLNWISGFPKGNPQHFLDDKARIPELVICEHAAVTNRHLIDCTDRVTIGRFSTLAGFRSQILTHSIDLETSKQRCKPVTIGDYCFVGTASIILGGSRLPDYAVLGAGSMLNSEFSETYVLYGGVPARRVLSLPSQYEYFTRRRGFVD